MLHEFSAPDATVLAFNPRVDGEGSVSLAIGKSDGTLEIHSPTGDGTNNWQKKATTFQTRFGIESLKWNPDGAILAIGTASDELFNPGSEVKLVSIVGDTVKEISTMAETSAQREMGAMAWSPDGTQLAVATGSDVIIHKSLDWESGFEEERLTI